MFGVLSAASEHWSAFEGEGQNELKSDGKCTLWNSHHSFHFWNTYCMVDTVLCASHGLSWHSQPLIWLVVASSSFRRGARDLERVHDFLLVTELEWQAGTQTPTYLIPSPGIQPALFTARSFIPFSTSSHGPLNSHWPQVSGFHQ